MQMSLSLKVESAQFSFGYPFHKWETKMVWLRTCSCVIEVVEVDVYLRLQVNYRQGTNTDIYRDFQNPCNTVFDLITQ